MVFEEFCGTCGEGIFILRQRNLNKQRLLKIFYLNIKTFYRVCCEVFQELQPKTGPCRALVL